MLAYIQQYLVQGLAGLLVLVLIACGVQTVRITLLEKDVVTLNETIKLKDALLATNAAELNKLKASGDTLQKKVDDSAIEIQKIERKHAEDIRRILTDYKLPPDATCEDAARWARDIARRKK